MGRITSTLTAACAATLLTAGVATAQGTLPDRKTNVTFSGPVSIPGATLPAGTYVFRIADSQTNRNIVQIFNKDESRLVTTLLAVPAERAEPEGDPVVAFKETPADRPPAVRYWYYAGERAGNEFIYPRAQAVMIARASGESVSAFETDSNDMDAWQKGGVSKVTPTTEPQPPSTATAAQPAPAPMTATPATTAPEPAPATIPPAREPEMTPPTPAASTPPMATSQPEQPVGTSGRAETLPGTASQLPTVGLIGLLALASAFALRAVRHA